MAKRVIKMRLSSASINETVKLLREYKEELRLKSSIFVQRLAELGLKIVEQKKTSFRGSSNGNDLNTYIWLDENDSKVTATLVLAGRDVAFVEFGAGIHYNTPVGTSPHPKGGELGLTIGSYGQGKGANDYWFYYDQDLGRVRFTYGTSAAKPMSSADEEIRNQFISVAREVFGK